MMSIKQYSARWTGQLIVMHDASPKSAIQFTPTRPTNINPIPLRAFGAEHWAITSDHPWDAAHHQVLSGGAVYAEPNCYQTRFTDEQLQKIATQGAGQKEFLFSNATKDEPHEPSKWGPQKGVDDNFSPVWYLDRAGFPDAHQNGFTGNGVRIAHLDTGCDPSHKSAPRNLATNEGHNFYDPNNPTNIIDTNHEWFDPGHGTGTIAILAGNKMDLDPKEKWGYGASFSGVVGCAPDATVVPVVIGGIGGSVIHLGDSSMTQGMLYAAGGNGRKPCDVVTISHGGYPLKSWAEAVNQLYDSGIIIVAAAGDWYREGLVGIPPHYTVYPAAFWRVITATGVTYRNTGYETNENSTLQGSYGPEGILKKSIAAYTPNVSWMKPGQDSEWEMSGGGTSASTPQIAAACALWVQKYGREFPADWRRVEACRYALIKSARSLPAEVLQYTSSHGALNAVGILDSNWVDQAIKGIQDGTITRRDQDRISWPLIRDLIGKEPPGNPEMYEVEAVQTVFRSTDVSFVELAYKDWQGQLGNDTVTTLSDTERLQIKQYLLEHDISNALRYALS
ncbi:S8/S53 family peptidase [Crenobacter sp. SG2303]|uniref:S8/S53 family peptidase n=1 Tax=Crenobacter oryzisoli TaxID=3056844 RepID=A0ABT7XV72_9NEIS|nr:S8/S53 family peptidase [Crenobacter sp. SG2303]MDN0077697.1 S8/S53 family peptidase [Crenobacter sp. SG2303]